MKIAIEGCAHGELDNIYSTIKEIEGREKIKVDLLICCGDFQSSRNEEDLKCMAVPPKYYNICSFYKYYNGEKKAPILTLFIGGNHEASNYLQELPYGGWVAPNIYYLGYASVINIAGIRIGGLSGIYKSRDFLKGRFERTPYNENTKRSVYHIRNLEVFRLKQLTQPIDIFLSHDWPTGVYNYGNTAQLLKRKPFFKEEVERGELGSKPCEELLNHLKPTYWFSAHLHCKFAAVVKHNDEKTTKFLALDKCLPKRKFLQIVDIPHKENSKIEIDYDLEWLTILHLTNHLLNVKNVNNYMPGPGGNERYNFTPDDDEKSLVLKKFNGSLSVPRNFQKTAVSYQTGKPINTKWVQQPDAKLNPQTKEFCEILGIDDPLSLISEMSGLNLSLPDVGLTNTTFVTDSEDSSSSDSLTTMESALVSQESSKLCSLNLPEPKQIVENLEDKCLHSEEELISVANSPKRTVDDLKLEENICDEKKRITESNDNLPSSKESTEVADSVKESISSNESGVVENSPKPPKKFKRRNAELYGAE